MLPKEKKGLLIANHARKIRLSAFPRPSLHRGIYKQKSLSFHSSFLFKSGGEGGIDSLALALRAAFGGPKRRCRFVKPCSRVLNPPCIGGVYKQRAQVFNLSSSSNLAVREGFEPSIRFHVYTLSRRAP